MSAETQKPNQADDDRAAGDARPEDAGHDETKRRHDELLDEGVEETFPASDPVAVKHIT
jgi:hypothetical protein